MVMVVCCCRWGGMVLDDQQLLWDRFIAGFGFRSGGRQVVGEPASSMFDLTVSVDPGAVGCCFRHVFEMRCGAVIVSNNAGGQDFSVVMRIETRRYGVMCLAGN